MIKSAFKRVVRWLSRIHVPCSVGNLIARVLAYGVAARGGALFFYPKGNRDLVARLNEFRETSGSGLALHEACQLYYVTQAALKVEGEFAEVGVFQGGSARIICEAKGDRPLHLFDTFAGLPVVEPIDQPQFDKGQYAASLETAREFLRGCSNVHFHAGVFPQTARPLESKSFALIHCDVDTYRSTQDCLKFFYPRLSRGGMILSHDYSHVPGVRKAFDEFFADNPESVLALAGTQCLVVKR